MTTDPIIEAEVQEALHGCLSAIAERNVEAFASLLTPDADVFALTAAELPWPDDLPLKLSRLAYGVGPSVSSIDVQRLHVGHAERVSWIWAHLVVRSAVGCDERASSLRLTGVLLQYGPTWLFQQLHFSLPVPAELTAGFTSSLDAVTAVVEQERVDLCNCAAPDGTVTLLFTDIENSTPIAEELGDLRWIGLLREHNRIVRECLAMHGGEEVKTIGDAFMVAFGSARRALLCAIAIQRAVSASELEDGEGRLRVRIGLHPGEPVREGNDFYGKSVVFASRIAGQARGGEILVSSLLRELAESAGDIRFDDGHETALKGLAGQHRLYGVLWA